MFFNPNKLIKSLKNENLSDRSKILYFILFFCVDFFLFLLTYLIQFDKSYSGYIPDSNVPNEHEISICINVVSLILILWINGAKDIFLRYVCLKTVLSVISFITANLVYFIWLFIRDYFDIFYKVPTYLTMYTILSTSLIYYFYKLNRK